LCGLDQVEGPTPRYPADFVLRGSWGTRCRSGVLASYNRSLAQRRSRASICEHANVLSGRPHMPEEVKKRLAEEIKLLEHELTTELPAEIKKAVALGDLSENAEYHMAKQRQVFVNARLGQLKKRMGELAMVNLVNIPNDKVGFGSRVTVFDSNKDEEIQYQLVTSEESDVAKGLISTTSPIGRALLGKQVGDIATVITPNGKRELEILKLLTIHDAAE
jgi:transcription elongation factor GreA